MNTIKSLGLALVLAVVGNCFIACGSDDLPSEVAIKFIKEVSNGDSDDALDMLELPEGLKDGEVDIAKGKLKLAIANVYEYSEEQGGIKNIELLKADKGDNFYNIELKVIYENGIEQKARVILTKIDNEWKVRDFNFR